MRWLSKTETNRQPEQDWLSPLPGGPKNKAAWRAMSAGGEIAIHLLVEVEVVESLLRVAELGLLFLSLSKRSASSSDTGQEISQRERAVRFAPDADESPARRPSRPGEVI